MTQNGTIGRIRTQKCAKGHRLEGTNANAKNMRSSAARTWIVIYACHSSSHL